MNQTYLRLLNYLSTSPVTPQLGNLFTLPPTMSDITLGLYNKRDLDSWIWEHQGQHAVIYVDGGGRSTRPQEKIAIAIYGGHLLFSTEGRGAESYNSWNAINDCLSTLDNTKNEWSTKNILQIRDEWEGWNHISFYEENEDGDISVNFEGQITTIYIWNQSAGEYLTKNLYEVYNSQELQDTFDSLVTVDNPIYVSWDAIDIRALIDRNFDLIPLISLNYPGGSY
jgi:hypothetical protein